MTDAVKTQVSLPPIHLPVVDKQTGQCDPSWYRFFETLRTRTGGDGDAVATNSDVISLKANADTTITVGNGLSGGGDLSNNVHIEALQDTGWTAPSGASDKVTVYAGYAGQVVSSGYVQAQAQQTDNAVKALAARYLALEAAIRANGGID